MSAYRVSGDKIYIPESAYWRAAIASFGTYIEPAPMNEVDARLAHWIERLGTGDDVTCDKVMEIVGVRDMSRDEFRRLEIRADV